MKKTSTFFGFMLFAISLFAAKNDTVVSRSSLYYPNCEKFSHWSVTAKAGLTVFDGDALQKYNDIIPQYINKIAAGGAVEYSFNPRWGLAVDYMYLPIAADEPNIKFHTTVHSPAIYLSTNLLNLFYDKRKSTRWAIYANLGAAFSFYTSTLERTSNPGTYIPGYVPNVPADSLLPYTTKDGRSFAVLFGLNIEYNISKHWAIGWYNQYRMQNKDNLEGAAPWKGITNDGIFATTLGVRYKFNSSKRCNVRNIDMATYNGKTDDSRKLADLEKRIKGLENRADSIEPAIANLNKRVDDIEQYLTAEPDDDGDGVPNIRDRHPNTPKGSFVNFWGEPLPDKVMNGNQTIPSIFFDFDKSALRPRSKEIIQELAFHLQLHPNTKVEIRGYCDNPGADNYNLKLSVNRCLAAQKELVEVYGIDASRIIINGFGKVIKPDKQYQLNRRCDFYLSK